jgi:hypothetical protein
LKAPVTALTLQTGLVEVEVWEENTTGDKLIGVGSAVLGEITVYGESVEVNVVLKNKKHKISGRVLISLRLEEIITRPLEVVKGFVCGVAYIRRVVSFGLRNTELFAMFGEKQDPYVCFSVKGPGGVIYWTGETPVLNNQGGDVIWDYLDLKLDVTREHIEQFNLDVTVKDKNTKLLGDAIIGVGSAPLVTIGISVSFIIYMLTLLLMPLAGLHFCIGLGFVTPLVVIFLK